MVDKATEAVIRWVLGYPKSCIVFCILLFTALAPGLGLFEEEYGTRSWWDEEDPVRVAFEEFETRFGDDGNLIVVLKDEKGIFNPNTVRIIKEMTEELQRLPNVLRVESLYNYNYVSTEGDSIVVSPFLEKSASLNGEELKHFLAQRKNIALSDPFLPDLFIDKEGKTTLLFAYLEPTFGKYIIYSELTAQAEEMIQRYRTENPELAIHIGGSGIIDTVFQTVARHDIKLIFTGFLLIVFLYLFFTFRSWTIPFLPLAVTTMVIPMVFGLSFYLGFTFSGTTQILPAIIVAISVADSVHILSYYYQCLAKGVERREALARSLRKNFLPSLLTTVSTFVGFFSFSLSEIGPIRVFGILGGISCFFAWLLTIFMLCPLMLWVKNKPPLLKWEEGQSICNFSRNICILD